MRRYVLRAIDEVHLPPFSGSTVRGAVGRALRRLVCATRQPVCDGCPVRAACAYAMLHDGFTPADRPSGSGEHAPPPLWLRDLEDRRKIAPGESVGFSMVAFGPAVASLPYVDEAVRGLGRSGLGRGRGAVALVEAHDEQRDGFGSLVDARVSALEAAVDAGKSLRVSLRSPVSIRLKGKAWEDPERPRPSWAERLLGGAVRRRVALERRWLDLASEEAPRVPRVIEDAAGLKVMEENIEVRRVKRFSASQGARMELHGVVGDMRLGGEGLKAALPWLVAGELLSVGAGTTFGFGRIELEAA
ncbi:CRISPR system precrRNA processing endoribonuclease RAMP protein Cas6 [Chondromyces crocatus]|uniref:CRISPR system precrRNA processing endoribonuclease RAMP protein Cas6 n=1 Tax=Chondromyces crocatus TaxID=52 RepID=UPI00146FF9A8|nr:CRISPR system precrRNA processing endoribonuclease RAMP protein Cas6 [Chondromyces crocatus]